MMPPFKIFAIMMMMTLLAGLAPVLHGTEPPSKTPEGFSIPQPGKAFEFPRDHASHPDFKIEWWYVTGHLYSEDGRRFGFQSTFFRQGNRVEGEEAPQFRHRQMHLAHTALLDEANERFYHEERINREGWDAAASSETLHVRNGNWSLLLQESDPLCLELKGSVEGRARWDLELRTAKPLVIFGENGVSRKAAAPSAASHYLTFTRLEVRGKLWVDGAELPVTGTAWMDHEISSSQLAPDQAGWDWAALQLKDGREMMVYRLRLKNGGVDPHSTLAWIDSQGRVEHVKPDAFTWEEQGHWESPLTKARYPVRVAVRTVDPATGKEVTLRLVPLIEAQEQTGSLGGTAYWEGACKVLDDSGKEVGSAFLELAGYSGDLSKQFE